MSSHLIPCKFFATNSCRFGDNCRFSHSNTTGNVFGGGRPFGASGFGGGTQDPHSMQSKGQNNLDAIVETVKKDIQEWEMGKIWPFSSYGPVGNKPSLPGLEDISVEEMRLKFLQNNRMPPDLTQEMRNMQMSRQSYQQPTPQIRDIIERVIVKNERITAAPGGGTSASVWNSSTNAPASLGIFGGGSSAVAAVPSVFGNASQSQSVFGGTPSMFQPSNTTVFGTATPASSSIFGAPAPGGFGTIQKPTESVETMDGSLTQQPTPSIFGGQPQPQPGGLFSTSQASPFQNMAQNSVFGSTFTQQQNVFQNQQPVPQPNSLFSATQPPVQQNIFQNATSPLAQPQPSAFQNISSPLSQPQPQASVFQTSSPFAPQNSSSINPAQQVTTTASPGLFNLLSQPVSTPPVQTTTQSASIFGGQAQASWPQAPSNNMNQPSQAASNQNFGQQILPVPSNEQKFVYSEESDLTMDQIEAFKADHFTLENIPTVPPPRAYCKL